MTCVGLFIGRPVQCDIFWSTEVNFFTDVRPMKWCMVPGQYGSEADQSTCYLQTGSLHSCTSCFVPLHGCTDGSPASSFSSLYLHYVRYVTFNLKRQQVLAGPCVISHRPTEWVLGLRPVIITVRYQAWTSCTRRLPTPRPRRLCF